MLGMRFRSVIAGSGISGELAGKDKPAAGRLSVERLGTGAEAGRTDHVRARSGELVHDAPESHNSLRIL